MSEEIALAAADMVEIARLRAELEQMRAEITEARTVACALDTETLVEAINDLVREEDTSNSAYHQMHTLYWKEAKPEITRLRAALAQAEVDRDAARRWARAWKQAAKSIQAWHVFTHRLAVGRSSRVVKLERELAVEKAKRTFLVRVLRRSEQMRREAKRRLAQVCALIERAGV